MSLYDYRSYSEEQISFYVFDDLRYQQNKRGEFNIYRYDTLSEAIAKFNELPHDMTTALGMHLDTYSELDLLHRREGENVLVSDYLNISKWRTSAAVHEALDTIIDTLKPEWQMDHKCIGESILIPLDRFDTTADKYFNDKNLLPQQRDMPWQKASPISAVTEAYVDGKGWVDFKEVFAAAQNFGYQNAYCPKVQKFNFNYEDTQGHRSQADIGALDLQILRERYMLQHGNAEERKHITDRMANEVADLTCALTSAEYPSYLDALKRDFISGDTTRAMEALAALKSSHTTNYTTAMCDRLITRMAGIPSRKRTLDHQIQNAGKNTSHEKDNQTHSQKSKER